MKYLVATLFFIACWLMPNCSGGPIVQAVKAKHPECDVLKVDTGGNVVNVTLQCPGNRIKVITMHDNS